MEGLEALMGAAGEVLTTKHRWLFGMRILVTFATRP